MNSVDSGLCQDDLETILGGENLPSSIHLPKVKDREELEFLWHQSEKIVGKRNVTMGLIMFIETARSLLDVDLICKVVYYKKKLKKTIYGDPSGCASKRKNNF